MAQKTASASTETARRPGKVEPKWYKRPWIVPLFIVTGLFILLRLPAYVTFDTGDSLVDLREGFAETHYLLLSGHIVFGSIALITCSMQVWPWLRNTHPKVHRVSGRLYVFAGVVPSGILAGVVSVVSVVSPAGKIGNLLLTALWFWTTFAGLRAARRHRYKDHRRSMIRSFALCFSIVVNRLWLVLFIFVLIPFVDGYYGGDQAAMVDDASVAAIWASWVVNLMIAQWWLDRRPKSRRRNAIPRQTTAETAAG